MASVLPEVTSLSDDESMPRARRRSSPSPRKAHTPPRTTPTYLTRKAQKYSSLKKKKGATTLLNKLFCTSPSEASSTYNTPREIPDENLTPNTPKTDRSSLGDAATCVANHFVEALMNLDDKKVRQTLSCSSPTVDSPPQTPLASMLSKSTSDEVLPTPYQPSTTQNSWWTNRKEGNVRRLSERFERSPSRSPVRTLTTSTSGDSQKEQTIPLPPKSTRVMPSPGTSVFTAPFDEPRKEKSDPKLTDIKNEYSQTELEEHIAKALAVESKKVRSLQDQLKSQKLEFQETLSDHAARWKREHEQDVTALQKKYDRELLDQKDQVALSQKLALSRLREMEQVKKELESNRESSEKQVEELSNELETIRGQLETMEEELAVTKVVGAVKSPRRAPSRASTPPSTPKALQDKQVETLRRQIQELEEQASQRTLEHKKALEELKQTSQQEIGLVKKDLEAKLVEHQKRERELKATLAKADDKEELLEKIEKLELERKMDRNGGLREVQKKEELLQKIAVLEKKEKELISEHSRTLQDLRDQSEAEIHKLQRDIEKEYNRRLEREKELQQSISETSSFEKEELLEKIEKLESELQNEKKGFVLMKMKLASAEKELASIDTIKAEEFASREKDYRETIDLLEKKVAQLETTTRSLDEADQEKASLLEKIASFEKELDAEKAKRTDQFADVENLHKQELDALRKEYDEKLAKAKESDAQLELLRKESKDTIEELRRKAQSQEDEIELLSKKSGDEDGVRDELERVKSEKSELEKELERALSEKKKIEIDFQDSHRKELDDVIAQLDLMEAEFKEEKEGLRKDNAELQQSISDKESVISALGAQIAELNDRYSKIEESKEIVEQTVTAVRQDSEKAQQRVRHLEGKLKSLTGEFEAFRKEADRLRDEACEAAREETIERAEAQFQQANSLYMKLKKQYNLSKEKVDSLTADLDKAKRQLEANDRRLDERDAEHKAEVADLKSSIAKAEVEHAKKLKEHRQEMDKLLMAADNFEKKQKAATETSRNLQSSLSTFVADNDRLKKELAALKNDHEDTQKVCEELLAELEGRQNNC